ncbi:hypothetical protein COLO4_32401 [Corchorus olitorius]|uniref:Late embryogenesis abundant protein, LEA-14 n=1 Tax=Corchorus olitorius TaxID=93759 RepID=A0A1R3GZD0_9ROSI|nr:hypothetical protein COLO4_32401 [Corchorus olitorius]
MAAKNEFPYSFSPLSIEDPSQSHPVEKNPPIHHHLREAGNKARDAAFEVFEVCKCDEDTCLKIFGFTFIGIVLFFMLFSALLSPPDMTLHPNTFSFSNYTANFEADLIFGCEKCHYEKSSTIVYYNYIAAYLSYPEIDGELSSTQIKPFNMTDAEYRKFHVSFGNKNQSIEVDDQIGKKGVGETLHLTLEVHLDVAYKLWGKYCEKYVAFI